MKSTTHLQKSEADALKIKKQRSYNEIVEFLDAHWETNTNDTTLTQLSQLDQALDSPSKKVATIIVGGTNGKSLTIEFTSKLLREESLTVGSFVSPHFLTYNERFLVNSDPIINKHFTEVGNTVLGTAEELGLKLNSYELLTMMALVHFREQGVDVALLETVDNGLPQATSICTPSVAGITRIAEGSSPTTNKASLEMIQRLLNFVQKNTHVVSADQSKLNLQTMQHVTEQKDGVWSMPIRKLATLPYPFEQLHGRCAALAERLASIFVNNFVKTPDDDVTTLLTRKKGQRGRPTLEAKRRTAQNPQKTLEQFWKDTVNTLPGRFQVLTKEKPTVLLDNARNIDAIRNLLLGIRLMHYQRPIKGLTLILGNNNNAVNTTELLKLLRYFFKKTSGSIIVCPAHPAPGTVSAGSWNAEQIANDLKNMKIKAMAAQNFKDAFAHAQQSVDERHGLIVVTGSQEMITQFWQNKGLKKI